MNSFSDVCYKLAEISKTLEPEHFFFFITVFGIALVFELLFQIINVILQFWFKILDERKELKKLSSQNDTK